MLSVPEDLIIRYLQKTATKEEIQLLNSWLHKDKQHIALYCQLEEIWVSKNRLSEKTIQEGWNRLHRNIKANQPEKRHRLLWMRYVAAIFIGILIGSVGWIHFQSKEIVVEKELLVQNKVHNQNGVQAISLPDNSEVWLNENSTISYPEQFKSEERLVSLEGNAYFEIRKNTSQSFIVCLGNVDITVTGTEFFVENKAENTASITLISGGVDINYTNETGNKTLSSLIPGQQADVNKLNGAIQITNVDTHYYAAWKDGTYRFTDEPLESIVLLLARHFELNIQVAPSLQKKRFTGRVTPDDNISDVMEVINKSYPVKYRITGKTVNISDY